MDFLPIILLVLAFALLIVLPARQRKKLQANALALQESLTVGTPVMLTSGLHGTVAGLGEGTVDIEIAPGVVATFARPAVMEVRRPAGGDAGLPGDGAGPSLSKGDDQPTDRTP